jgi:hypothetical protein
VASSFRGAEPRGIESVAWSRHFAAECPNLQKWGCWTIARRRSCRHPGEGSRS